MNEFTEIGGYVFNNSSLLREGLTHSSYANENRNKKINSNERLEFLGDSILGLISAEYLFSKYPDLPEGELTKIRAAVVCEKTLCQVAKDMEIDKKLLLGKGEEAGGGRQRSSILADAVEAVLAAVYLDGGFSAAKKFAMTFIPKEVELANKGRAFRDYKTALQEIVQKNKQEVLTYSLKGERGPDHDKRFTVELLLNSNHIAEGEGRSKKEAEQMAAKAALELMGQNT